jgi:hypothetical protein
MQADGHFGGGRLGEGQAQDARGVGRFVTRQHQPQQTVDQQFRFAGAGMRGDEGGHRRVRRQILLVRGARGWSFCQRAVQRGDGDVRHSPSMPLGRMRRSVRFAKFC